MTHIEIKNLSKYFGENKVLSNINLNISKGEIFGIIGLSGAGKSTLIRTINKLENIDNGNIYVNSKDIFKLNLKETREYRKKTSMIFQNFSLLSSRTVFENIALPLESLKLNKEDIKNKVEKLIKLVHLEGKENVYVNNLSGGQKQRVAIARAISTDPEILLSDESTSALDPITSNSILDLLKEINSKLGITIILITHQMEVIKKICDRVAVLKDGEILELSTVEEMFLNPKTEFTKKLISELKVEIQTGTKNVLNLHFDENSSDKPYISILSRKFNLDVNILGGKIDTMANKRKVGNLVVEIISDKIETAISWLKENGIKVEVIK